MTTVAGDERVEGAPARVADRGEVVNCPLTDVADERFAEVEPDADVERGAVRRALADVLEHVARVFEYHHRNVTVRVVVVRRT